MYLIDLIYQRKRSSGFLGKTHKVENSGQGTFLIHSNSQPRSIHSSMIQGTHATRLSLSSEQLQFLAIAELDQDVNRPLVVVFVFTDAYLASASNA